MRLLLDANLSGRRIARSLREDGHDILALSERPDLEGLSDPGVLALAASERRILVTRNSRDFAPLLRDGPKRVGRMPAASSSGRSDTTSTGRSFRDSGDCYPSDLTRRHGRTSRSPCDLVYRSRAGGR
jgi:hypothetical protein